MKTYYLILDPGSYVSEDLFDPEKLIELTTTGGASLVESFGPPVNSSYVEISRDTGDSIRSRILKAKLSLFQKAEDSEVETPAAGSDAAHAEGCVCPRHENAYGKGYRGTWGVFTHNQQCPIH